MPDLAAPLRPMARLYLLSLRLSGWVGLAVLPVFAFAFTLGYVDLPDHSLFVFGFAVPGVLVSVFLAGTPDRPTFLLRPTRFLKAFFVCGFFLGLAHTAILIHIIMLMSMVQIGPLLTAVGLGFVDPMAFASAWMGADAATVEKLRSNAGFDVASALMFMAPSVVLSWVSGIIVWFARFPTEIVTPKRVLQERLERQARDEASQQEKTRAFKGMQKRMARRRLA